jgi:hypothetical protein
MNGEMLVVANNFLVRLNKEGFVSSEIRVRSIAHMDNSSIRTNFFNYEQFYSTFAQVITSNKPWEYVGDYLFVESMNISYPRLGYTNLFRCYDILNRRKIVQTIGVSQNSQSDSSLIERSESVAVKVRSLDRTIDTLNKEFNLYKTSANETYAKVLQYYVDRNFVNDNYIDIKSNLLTK